ncbi:MAG: TIGR00300 family protein [Acidobacteria bacterium]|nr:TIGR00300 family protein [Acidobacteriota bacterium]
MHTETIEAQGHLIDSHLLEAVFDKVIEHGAKFEIVKFQIGRTNEEFSHLVMKVHAPEAAVMEELLEELLALGCHRLEQTDALVRPCDADGCAPEDFYSTTNHRTEVRHNGKWITVQRQRMDSAIVVHDGQAACVKLRDLRAGDKVVCGAGGLRVLPDFKERERSGFAFMSSEVSSERRVELAAGRVAELLRGVRAENKRAVVVAGPVVVHTGAADKLAALVREGYVGALLAGNALAVHDAELALFGTSLGMHLERGVMAEHGHRNHMRAINLVRRAGGIRAAVETGLLKQGILYECVRRGVPFVLAGSIRDDGPMPETVTDMLQAQNLYAEHLRDAALILCLGTMLHSIGTANMVPSWIPLVAVDINPAVVTKIADRGSSQTIGLVTDVGLFLHLLHTMLK